MEIDYRQIKTVKAQVMHVLEYYPETRNSDAVLNSTVCRLFRDKNDLPYDPLKVAETIRRSRQYFNAKGYFLPTDPEVAKHRNRNVDEYRVAMGYPTKDTAGTGSPSYTPPSEKKIDRF